MVRSWQQFGTSQFIPKWVDPVAQSNTKWFMSKFFTFRRASIVRQQPQSYRHSLWPLPKYGLGFINAFGCFTKSITEIRLVHFFTFIIYTIHHSNWPVLKKSKIWSLVNWSQRCPRRNNSIEIWYLNEYELILDILASKNLEITNKQNQPTKHH